MAIARILKAAARIFAGTCLLYVVTVAAGTGLVLLVAECVGYLPYSDRPGPGWRIAHHWPVWKEVLTYGGFAVWFGYSLLFFGVGLFGLSLLLGFASTPRWLNRVLGGLIAGASACLAVAAAGWSFALSAFGPDVAAVLGLVYGAFLFPKFVPKRSTRAPLWARVAAASGASLLFLWWVISPLLPHKPAPEIRYSVDRLAAGTEEVTWNWPKDTAMGRALASLNLRGVLHGGIQGDIGSGSGASEVDVELIALEPIHATAQLGVPKSGYVIYVLQNGKWKAYPKTQGRNFETLMIGPGKDPHFESGNFSLDQPEPSEFTWYPTIPKGQ